MIMRIELAHSELGREGCTTARLHHRLLFIFIYWTSGPRMHTEAARANPIWGTRVVRFQRIIEETSAPIPPPRNRTEGARTRVYSRAARLLLRHHTKPRRHPTTSRQHREEGEGAAPAWASGSDAQPTSREGGDTEATHHPDLLLQGGSDPIFF